MTVDNFYFQATIWPEEEYTAVGNCDTVIFYGHEQGKAD